MYIGSDSFTEVSQHAMAVNGWQQTYDQLGKGKLSSTLYQFSTDNFHLFYEELDKRVVQYGCPPKDRVCLAIPYNFKETPLLQGKTVHQGTILSLTATDEFVFHAPENLRLLALTISYERFMKIMSLNLSAEKLQSLLGNVIAVPKKELMEACLFILEEFNFILATPKACQQPNTKKLIEDKLLCAFINVFASTHMDKIPYRLSTQAYSAIVKESHEIAINSDEPTTITELCEHFHISRRTLQNSFKLVANTTPIEYLRNVRLNKVRRDLLNTYNSELSVGDAAFSQGFYHLSHFAIYYKQLFGELPSETHRLTN